MKRVAPSRIDGRARAPASKSMMQRAVAAAALCEGKTTIRNPSFCDDGCAAIRCAKALGAIVKLRKDSVEIAGNGNPTGEELDCGESGLCMRMFAPIAALFGTEILLVGKGTLAGRRVGMMQRPLETLGAVCKTDSGMPPIAVKGPMNGGAVEIDGSESSQFLTGLLMALPLCKRDSVVGVANLKSKPYARMTLSLLGKFGVRARHDEGLSRFEIKGNQKYCDTDYCVEGDWSGSSFLLVAGAIAGRAEVEGLDPHSLQADRAIVDALELAGAKVNVGKARVAAEKGCLSAFEFDATDCPDLFPPLVALACNCKGKSRITGVGRLRGKESDRSGALVEEFTKLGASISVDGDVMVVAGKRIAGGKADSHNDHRIAMACAVAALASDDGVEVENEGCVSKSYPQFFEDIGKMCAVNGGKK